MMSPYGMLGTFFCLFIHRLLFILPRTFGVVGSLTSAIFMNAIGVMSLVHCEDKTIST